MSGDMVSRGVFEQVMWERDVAIGQLKELGYGFGQKIEPCGDVVNRKDLLKIYEDRFLELQKMKHLKDNKGAEDRQMGVNYCINILKEMPLVTPQQKMGQCKDCKYFEYDSVAKVDGIPLIVAHEICKRWGDGCKTKEDGYCFLFEPQESEE